MKRFTVLATGSEPSAEAPIEAALHRLRSAIARLSGEIELARGDGLPPGAEVDRALQAVLGRLAQAEDAVASPAPRVLLLDDDAGLADVTARRLRRDGFRVETSAVALAPSPGQVTVADLGLLVTAEPHLQDAIRTRRPILVSGASLPVGRRAAQDFGSSAFLQKPVPYDVLVAAIRARAGEQV